MPIALSVPHAGLVVPDFLTDNYLLSSEQTVADGDVGSFEIYSLQDEVAHFTRADLARAVLDMNRSATDTERPDGVVKTLSCWQEPVWRRPLTQAERAGLIQDFHKPYHRTLRSFAGKAKLSIDCHTMSDVGPPIGPDPGRRRPLICLSDGDGTTCPASWVAAMQECLARYFSGDVHINEPFHGGYITRSHGSEMPWLQLELSRTDELSIAEKREGVRRALHDWCHLNLEDSHAGTPVAKQLVHPRPGDERP
ncbi:MAG: N-formylglutamate amidohydrolase [Planctomycetota bacterium]